MKKLIKFLTQKRFLRFFAIGFVTLTAFLIFMFASPLKARAMNLLHIPNISTFLKHLLTPSLTTLNLGKGKIIASNVLYGLKAGEGLSVRANGNPQIPTLTNTGVISLQGKNGNLFLTHGRGIGVNGLRITNLDPGSAQKMFETIQVNGTNISADTNTDAFAITSGSGISLGTNPTTKSLSITNTSPTQWSNNNSDIYYTSGNVGIGVLPSYALDVYSSNAIAGRFSGRVIGGNAINSNEFITLGQFSSGTGQFWQLNNGALSPSTISSDLLVGGTATSSALFQVFGSGSFAGTATTSGSISFTGATTSINQLNGYALNFDTSASGDYGLVSRLNISNNGNIGIGTTSPGYQLDVQGSNGNANFQGGNIYFAGNKRISDTVSSSYTDINPQGSELVLYNPSNSATNNNLRIFGSSGSKYLDLWQNSAASQISSGGTTVLALQGGGSSATNNGGVSIGTTAPLGQTALYIKEATANEALLVDQEGTGSIFTASQGGALKFSIANNGDITTIGKIIGSGNSATIADSPNLIPNAGFDAWSSTTSPYDWQSANQSNWNTGTYVHQESSTVYYPPYSAKLGDGIDNGTGVAMTNSLQIIPGTSYMFGAKIAGGDTTAQYIVVAKAYQSDGVTEITTGTPLGSGWTYSAGYGGWFFLGTPATTSFVDATKRLDLSSSVYYLRFSIQYYTGGTTSDYIYVDDVKLNHGTILPAFAYKPLYDTGNQTLESNLTVRGNVTLGTNSTNTITPNGLFNASLIPSATSVNLGSATNNFGTLYAQNIVTNATSGQSGFWQLTSGALAPANITNDLLLGGTATTSATFGFLNVAGGTPTATISSNLSLKVPTGANPAATFNILNGGSLNFQTAATLQGDGGLTSRLFIANNGNIGIGTAVPSTKLDILGGNSAHFTFDNSGVTSGYSTRFIMDDTGLKIGDNSSSRDFRLQTNSLDRIVIASGGNVGIGTNNPGALLQISGGDILLDNNSSLRIKDTSGNANAVLKVDASNNLQIFNGATSGIVQLGLSNASNTTGSIRFYTQNSVERMRLDANGNLGIGTTTPLATFDVRGQSGTTPVASISGQTAKASLVINNDGMGDLITASSSGTTAFRIDNSGNITDFGNLAVNGGNITTTQTTANIFNATPTTLNIGGVATTINLGAATGTTSIKSNLSVSGTTTFNNVSYTWPSAQSANQFLQTDGSGNLSWVTSSATNYWQANGSTISPSTLTNSVGINTISALGTLDVRALSGTQPIATLSGSTSFAGLVVDNSGKGDLFTASASGLSRFVITQNGTVGVGTGTPSTTTPNGWAASSAQSIEVRSLSTTTDSGIFLRRSDASTGLDLWSHNATGDVYIDDRFSSPTHGINFRTGTAGTPVNAMYINASNGNVGIGTTAPTTLLDVNGSASVSGSLNFRTGAGSIQTTANNTLTLGGSTTGNIILSPSNNTGFVGIGTSTPGYGLDLQSSAAATAAAEIYNTNNGANADGLAIKLGFTGNGTVPTSQTAGNSFERYLNGNGVAQGSIDSNGLGGVTYNTNGIDFAEYFTKAPNTSFAEGDVVSLGGTDGQMATKATSAYDPKLLGIVSAHPGYVGGTPGDNKVLVGLTGQLPVKVSTENGAIQAGDMLTSSNTLPGVAMKATRAGQIIAKALESYSGQGVGTILVYVSATYADPTVQITDSGDLSVNGQVAGAATQPNPTTLAGDTAPVQSTTGVTADQFNNLSTAVANLQSQMASQTAQLGKIDDLSKQLAELEKTVNLNQALAGMSTQSAVLGASTTNEDTIIGGKLSVSGRTLLGDVGITGVVNDGLLTINGMDTSSATPAATINTLSAPLKIQSFAAAGVDFENGKVTIDTDGNLVTQGDITAKTVKADQYEVNASGDNPSIGEATIPAGKTSVEIKTSAVTDTSKVFVTSKTNIAEPLNVTSQTSGKSFTVELNKPLNKDIHFNWWIVSEF